MGPESWNALIRKSMITAVHPVEDRYLNVREMMHLMGLPHDFQVRTTAIKQNIKTDLLQNIGNLPNIL
jgi:site-specific DNA-cytosine methylase